MGRSEERLRQKRTQIYRLSIKLLKDLRNGNESDVGKGRGCQRPGQKGLTGAINLSQGEGVSFRVRQWDEKIPTQTKREARPLRHGGEEANWGLQIKNERAAGCGVGERGTWPAEASNKDTEIHFWLAAVGGGGFETCSSKAAAKIY